VARAQHIGDRRNIVVCTTTDPSDDPLRAVVEDYGASLFRGATHDIVRRFADAMDAFGFDAVLQVNGDNPLSATEYMDATMERLLADSETDIVSVSGLPLGTAVYSFRHAAMQKVLSAYTPGQNDTGFIYFFTKSGLCQHAVLDCTDHPRHHHPNARLTLDYPVDLELFRHVFGALYRPGAVFSLADVVAFLYAHPELTEMNLAVDQKYWQRTADKAHLEYRDPAGTLRKVVL
jgi:spore coat polysaccharide biosynthesis protein SpsF (cytidylyltransferase family)